MVERLELEIHFTGGSVARLDVDILSLVNIHGETRRRHEQGLLECYLGR